MATMADSRGWSRPVALQVEYSLAERTVERELVPMAAELGLGIMPFALLAMGILAGGYSRADLEKDNRWINAQRIEVSGGMML